MVVNSAGLKRNILIKYKTALKNVFLTDFIEDYMKTFEYMYDNYLDRADFKQYDKTAPVYLKKPVMDYIRNSLVEGVKSMDINGSMKFSAINEEVFERPDLHETDSLRLFYFYMHGTPGYYASLTTDMYEKMFPSSEKWRRLGRFGNMHLVTKHTYEQWYHLFNGAGNGWPAYSEIEHPFSGAAPVRIFDMVWDVVSVKFNEYAEKALNLITKS